ncbi:hypothetical protein QJS10_CPB15g00073 [Acorus calamus]|uniref:AP-5 complex subunit beta-1 n=1 Tax=Acorus calamus TaxID=4465 RepID=A0AAV9D3Q8_ACOCL|nr:hypothetical protein QJS10_CPB15g00073 [Acorus calamus]
MEKPPQPPPLPLPNSASEWETLIDDFQSGRRDRWLSQHPGPSLLDHSLHSLLRRDFPLRLPLLLFLEEFAADSLVPASESEPSLSALLDSLRSVVQSPSVTSAGEASSVSTYLFKEQMMSSVTAIAISIDGLESAPKQLEWLVELLLAVANRPNHGPDRQSRAVACECLRELELAYPGLLSEVSGNIWNICQAERTHASQAYILLLTAVIRNMVVCNIRAPILTSSAPLIPFNAPKSDREGSGGPDLKELRRAVAFLLERAQSLTSTAVASVFVPAVAEVVAAGAAMSASALKVQFSGLLYSYDPLLTHVVLLTLSSRFPDASAAAAEPDIARRLMLIPREAHRPLPLRLLPLHWFLGSNILARNTQFALSIISGFYPTVFDPLALKALKLDVLARCAVCLDRGEAELKGVSPVKLMEDSLVCVSGYKWLPPRSTETAMAFRALHRFLIAAVNRSNDPAESVIFHAIQNMLVDMALEFRRLVPVIVVFVDRLMSCGSAHLWLGERLLQNLDEQLLPKVVTDHRFASYFPIFDRIAENEMVPPRGLLELLMKYMASLVEKHSIDTHTSLRSWSQGSKVLGVCRTMLVHHHSSRVFRRLSRLLAFTCQYFPDLEVRDNARIYLRMLLCVPGEKLRHILNVEEQLPRVSPAPHPSTFSEAGSPRPEDLKKSLAISSYIHLERVFPLLVKQSWSLALPSVVGVDNNETESLSGIRDSSIQSPEPLKGDADGNTKPQILSETEKIGSSKEPLRVTDSKSVEVVRILRGHFACIPDYRHMPGLKVKIPCVLHFDSEALGHAWGIDPSASGSDGVDALPSLCAIVISFSSSARYGSIPPFHVPFLIGEPPVPIEEGSEEDESFRARVMVELEPREPMPGLIDVRIEANVDSGQSILGSLKCVAVGMEDLFLKAVIPPGIPENVIEEYNVDLFHALWEACGNPASTGREAFPLRGGRGLAAINGTRSVKLLEVSSISLIHAVELHLAPFVVSVTGELLVDAVKDGGIIRDVIWKVDSSGSDSDGENPVPSSENGHPLQLKYIEDENLSEGLSGSSKRNMGCFLVLIFLPPRFHLLLWMEVSDTSTLIRIRTDHWPCLAYIDDYLEAVFLK